MTNPVRVWLDRFERWGTAAENFLIVVLLVSLMVLAVGEIALREFFSVGFVWAGDLINLIVLWITIVASIAASRSDRHLRIDALSLRLIEAPIEQRHRLLIGDVTLRVSRDRQAPVSPRCAAILTQRILVVRDSQSPRLLPFGLR